MAFFSHSNQSKLTLDNLNKNLVVAAWQQIQFILLQPLQSTLKSSNADNKECFNFQALCKEILNIYWEFF